jgi:hypothetical protein
MSTYEKDREAALLLEQRGKNEVAWKRWLVKHPNVKDCIANRKAIFEYIDDTDELVEADFDFVYSNIGDTLAHQRVPTVAEENARRRSLSMSELHELSRVENPVPQPDTLPETYVPIGKKRPVLLTADALRRAGTRTGEISIADLKFLLRRFGPSEVNKRLGVKPTIQPGYSTALEI